ncbi:MAG TPA: hypothetical protein VJJ48_01400 [Candidatus Paceibacterota bacterium]
MDKLCALLKSMKFYPVLGTTEYAGGNSKPVEVKKGKPLTWDRNNGVAVVYDEDGCPWIKEGFMQPGGCGGLTINQYILTRGAYVPHSNDGGYFVREVLPKL